ncbi:MAG TPA: beta-ketoacyl-[acyl-carrier-protein] synthase family protein [Pirellulaceae bacterium]|nr:beta-ketoacyl-[acyl-carrier-protein] synthase family protein [Pirellulaceae bacterium]HMO92983.1 beta-ketoacyl-[acyl-carrier-protein] synthase family protein [Pirellulaceae bacterium]HMP67938.1 beta-ketoacyl-[acyl-carrier-protein] synthase family protein [Pirellulaceae bacterium]
MSLTRVVITGMGQISPLGIGLQELWDALSQGRSGIATLQRIPHDVLPTSVGGEARSFTGDVSQFGTLDKAATRAIRKGLKLMCREIEMGVAAAQWAMSDAGLVAGTYDAERIGCVFGCDYTMTLPEEFSDAMHHCSSGGKLQFERWGQEGLSKVDPLWLLKYLPNMPASHVAIYNDLRGPSNSLTLRESSANLAVAEAFTTLQRNIADTIVCCSTGSRIHPLRSVHTALQEQLAQATGAPEASHRPFDVDRNGMVIGEGAGAIVLETEASARARGVEILAEVVGYASSTVADQNGVANYEQAFVNVIEMALKSANMLPGEIGHIHAHGLATVQCDRDEARAIWRCFGEDQPVTTAAKSYMGNLGAGSGLVEIISSVLAIRQKQLFAVLNCENQDPECPIRIAKLNDDPGSAFINLNITPQGQASAVIIRAYQQ